MTTRLTYTIQETAEALGVSQDLVRSMCDRGDVAFLMAGRRKLIRAESLELFIERNTQRSTPKA